MRKSTLFISAVLTTFVMAMLAGVASAYQNMTKAEPQPVAAQAQPQIVPVSNPAPTEAPAQMQPAVVNFTPEQAADLAAQVMGRDDLFSVEVTDLNGETVYLVTFSSGDLVYVSFDRQIRLIGKLEVETVVINTGRSRGEDDSGSNKNTTSSSTSRDDDDDDHDDDHEEEHEEHEEHDDD